MPGNDNWQRPLSPCFLLPPHLCPPAHCIDVRIHHLSFGNSFAFSISYYLASEDFVYKKRLIIYFRDFDLKSPIDFWRFPRKADSDRKLKISHHQK